MSKFVVYYKGRGQGLPAKALLEERFGTLAVYSGKWEGHVIDTSLERIFELLEGDDFPHELCFMHLPTREAFYLMWEGYASGEARDYKELTVVYRNSKRYLEMLEK